MVNRLGRIFDKICLCIGALLFSQFPLFIQYYSQQLSGRVFEMQRQIEAIREVASHSGKDIDQYIQKFLSSNDTDFILQGQLMQQLIVRWHYYTDGLLALEHASLWMQPVTFVRYFDWSIAKSTLENYSVGFTLNSEGFLFAGLGILIGFLFSNCIKWILKGLYFTLCSYLKVQREKKHTKVLR
jgi:DUF2937 family protein